MANSVRGAGVATLRCDDARGAWRSGGASGSNATRYSGRVAVWEGHDTAPCADLRSPTVSVSSRALARVRGDVEADR